MPGGMMKDPDCGGCKGLGAHSRRCSTNPAWMWHRLDDMAGGLADFIGSNDVVAANLAYAIQGRMRAHAAEVELAHEEAAKAKNQGAFDE